MEKYELVKDIGSGNFGVARLMRNRETKELVAMKYIERGYKVLLPFHFHYSPFVFLPRIHVIVNFYNPKTSLCLSLLMGVF